MKLLIIGGGLVAVAVFFLMKTGFMESKVDCPNCQGTGRVLPSEEICGGRTERTRLGPMTKLYALCYSSSSCEFCDGKGQVAEDKAEEIPDGLYVMPNIIGEDSAVVN